MSTVKIQSVSRALSILSYIAQKRGAGVSEISRALTLNKSTVYGLMKTLELEGYIFKNVKTEAYELTLKLFTLGSYGVGSSSFIHFAKPYIEALAQKFGETVHLVAPFEDKVVYIDKIESTKSIRIYTRVGHSLPLHCTGVGKAIMAYWSEEEVESYIEQHGLTKYTKNTITDPKKFKRQLALIKANGYAIDDEENLEELFCIAAPVLDMQNQARYGISIAKPKYRSTIEIDNLMIEEILKVSRQLAEGL